MLFSVFTPVFNRRNTIHRVWESLRSQTCRDFEWIVVDDGSTDNIIELLRSYEAQADFPVRVVQQTNGGKHVAWDLGVNMAQGELFVPADSDDAFVPETLQRFKELWLSIDSRERTKFSGINVLCKDPQTGKVIGSPFPQSPMVSQNLELAYIHKVTGEKWGCLRVDVLREVRFPTDEQLRGNVVSENYLWFTIARRYVALCVNEPLRLYYRDAANSLIATQNTGQLSEQLTHKPAGRYFYHNWQLNTNLDYLWRDWRGLAKTLVHIWVSGLLTGKTVIGVIRDNKGVMPLVLRLAAMPLGLAVYGYCRRQTRK